VIGAANAVPRAAVMRLIGSSILSSLDVVVEFGSDLELVLLRGGPSSSWSCPQSCASCARYHHTDDRETWTPARGFWALCIYGVSVRIDLFIIG
jgi:hypothetical protein